MNEKLKPCPHCGGRAVFQNYHTAIDDKLFPNRDNSFWYVLCENCRAGSWYYDTQAQAAEFWNTRDTFSRKVVRVVRRLLARIAVKVLAKFGEGGCK